MIRILKRLTISLGLFAVAALVLPSLAHASTAPPVQGAKPGAVSFAASPTRVVIGKTPLVHKITVSLVDTSNGPITLRSTIHQLFQSGSKTASLSAGNPLPGSGANWITVSPSVVSMSHYGQHATATVIIRVPVHHAPGQKYLAVAWAPVIHAVKLKGGAGATVSSGLNTPEILLNVTGKVIYAPHYSLSAPGFSGGGSIGMHYTVNNHASNVYSLNNGQVVLNGKHVIARIPGSLLLAGSTAGQSITWQHPPVFGIDQHLTAYSNGKPVAHATVALIIPIWYVVGGVAILLGIFLAYRIGSRDKRRERKRLKAAG